MNQIMLHPPNFPISDPWSQVQRAYTSYDDDDDDVIGGGDVDDVCVCSNFRAPSSEDLSDACVRLY